MQLANSITSSPWENINNFQYFPQYLSMLAVAYEKTLELSKDLRSVGCGDLDVEGTYYKVLKIN